jgi:hypothetical protein
MPEGRLILTAQTFGSNMKTIESVLFDSSRYLSLFLHQGSHRTKRGDVFIQTGHLIT